jgi:hypothetical protein
MLVAVRFFKRRRAKNPKEGVLNDARLTSVSTERIRTASEGQTLNAGSTAGEGDARQCVGSTAGNPRGAKLNKIN